MAKYYGYCRVSSKKQGKKGTIQEQEKPVAQYLISHGVNKNEVSKVIYKDTFTGMTMHRPNFTKLMKQVNNGDTIVIAKLDRLSRNALNSMNFVKSHPHITFVILKPKMILSGDTPTTTKLLNDILMIFQQFDHDAIMDRFNAGKARAKAMGKRNYNGGIAPRFYGKKQKHYWAIFKYSITHTNTDTAKVFGVSRQTVQNTIRDAKEYIQIHKHTNKNQMSIYNYINDDKK